jgi:hypothetical protein
MTDAPIKVVVTFERREDGGLRVWSADLPGLVLSHRNIDAVLEDVVTAIGVILSERLGAQIEVQPLLNVREALENHGVVDPTPFIPGTREYVAYQPA